MYDATGSDTARTILNNLHRTYGPLLDLYTEHDILESYSEYATSEDYGDPSKFHNWLRHGKIVALDQKLDMSEITMVYSIRRDEYRAIWRGQVANATWGQPGPAQAWIDTCNAKNKFWH